MPFDQSSFLSPWRAAIKEAGERHKPSFPCWEGPKAYKDLKRAGLLNYILFQKEGSWFGGEQDWRSKKLFEQFAAAVAIYEADVQEFSKLRSESSAPNDLGNAARSLRPLTAGRHSRKIKGTATKLLQMLEDEVSGRERVNQRKRDEAFFAGLYG